MGDMSKPEYITTEWVESMVEAERHYRELAREMSLKAEAVAELRRDLNVDRYEYNSDADEIRDTEGRLVDAEYKRDSEDWTEEWDVEAVFFDRDEAKSWAEARSYRWRRWRTYAVSAEGDLARLLGRQTTYWDGKPYRVERTDKT